MSWGKGQANVVLVINTAAPQAFRSAASPHPHGSSVPWKGASESVPFGGDSPKKKKKKKVIAGTAMALELLLRGWWYYLVLFSCST